MSSNTSMVFKRGELRILSAALIEANRDKSISEVAALHVENFGFYEHKVAVVHVRWMLREGLVNDAADLMEKWSRRNDKSLVKAPKIKAPKVTETEVEASETPAPTEGKSMKAKKIKKAKVVAEVPAEAELETA